MFFLVFSMLLVGVAAGASDAAAGDTGVNRLVQVAVSAGAALLGGAQRRARMSVDPNLAVTVTVPWMPLLPATMDADSTIPELPAVRANQLSTGYASNVQLPPRKEATKKPLQTANRRLQGALLKWQQDGATEDLKIEIAQLQIKSYLLQAHFDSFAQSRPGVALVNRNRHAKKAAHVEQTRVARVANSNKVTEQTPPAKITRSQMQGFVHQQDEVVLLLDHLLDGGDVQDFDKQSNDAPPTSKRPKRAANTVDYCDTRAYAGKGALWEDLANAGKAKRATQIVDQLKGYAADDAAFDDMISRIICNPRLAGCSTAQAQRKHGQAELKDEICQRVKAALQQLKQSKVASSGDGYKVFHRIRSSLHCVTN